MIRTRDMRLWKYYNTTGTTTLSGSAPGPCGYAQVYQTAIVVPGSGFRIEGTDYSYYPNPASDHLTVTEAAPAGQTAAKTMSTTTSKVPASVKLKDSTGNVAQVNITTDGSSVTVDTSNLHDGLYYLIVTEGGKEYSERVMIKH